MLILHGFYTTSAEYVDNVVHILTKAAWAKFPSCKSIKEAAQDARPNEKQTLIMARLCTKMRVCNPCLFHYRKSFFPDLLHLGGEQCRIAGGDISDPCCHHNILMDRCPPEFIAFPFHHNGSFSLGVLPAAQ